MAHTVPQTWAEGEWKLKPGEHTIIPIKVARGNLQLSCGNQDISCIVKEKGKQEILNVQSFNTKQAYLTGKMI